MREFLRTFGRRHAKTPEANDSAPYIISDKRGSNNQDQANIPWVRLLSFDSSPFVYGLREIDDLNDGRLLDVNQPRTFMTLGQTGIKYPYALLDLDLNIHPNKRDKRIHVSGSSTLIAKIPKRKGDTKVVSPIEQYVPGIQVDVIIANYTLSLAEARMQTFVANLGGYLSDGGVLMILKFAKEDEEQLAKAYPKLGITPRSTEELEAFFTEYKTVLKRTIERPLSANSETNEQRVVHTDLIVFARPDFSVRAH